MKSIINQLTKTASNGLRHLQNGQWNLFWNQLVTRMYSKTYSFGLRRDLNIPYKAPDAKILLRIRPFKDTDKDSLLKKGADHFVDPVVEYNQKNLIDTGLQGCYVATTTDDTPCYMQWLIPYSRDNEDYYFEGIFPKLKKGEALLEGAFVPAQFRGKWIMPAAMARIASLGSEIGARWIITFVDVENIPSLKGCQRAGFSPYLIRKDRWFFFQRKVSFQEISGRWHEMFEKVTGR